MPGRELGISSASFFSPTHLVLCQSTGRGSSETSNPFRPHRRETSLLQRRLLQLNSTPAAPHTYIYIYMYISVPPLLRSTPPTNSLLPPQQYSSALRERESEAYWRRYDRNSTTTTMRLLFLVLFCFACFVFFVLHSDAMSTILYTTLTTCYIGLLAPYIP